MIPNTQTNPATNQTVEFVRHLSHLGQRNGWHHLQRGRGFTSVGRCVWFQDFESTLSRSPSQAVQSVDAYRETARVSDPKEEAIDPFIFL